MEKVVEELKKRFSFKEDTAVGDIVLIVAENPQALIYGYVQSIDRDITKKDEWWHVTLLLLAVPPQQVKWALRYPQFTGREIFTMGGDKRFIKALDLSSPGAPPATPDGGDRPPKKQLRVIK